MVLATVALTAGGCVSQGPDESNFGRRFSWYSYLAGDDIAKQCSPGSRDHIRFVYNGRWNEQTRAYDLYPVAAGARLEARVWPPGQGLVLTGPDAFQVRVRQAATSLDRTRATALERAMADSGVWGPAPTGLVLRSDAFYWTVAACRSGRFHFNAFAAPSAGFDRLTFPDLLFAADQTGVAVNPPRPLDLPPLSGLAVHRDSGDPGPGRVTVGPNGLDVPHLRIE